MALEQKIIPITCTGTSAISISDLVDLQGNLKSRSVEQIGKLRNQILKHGFSFPFFVWKDKKINYTLDGHGRTGVVKTLLEEGYLFKNGSGETTDKLPCDFISAKDKKEAKEKLLALNSQFGKITEQGFNDFINELNFEIDFESIKMDLELPDVDISMPSIVDVCRRPIYEGGIEGQEDKKNGFYFVIEYYNEEEKFNKLQEFFKDNMEGKNAINPDYFYEVLINE